MKVRKSKKNMVAMISLSVLLILWILFFPEYKNILSVVMLAFGIFFAFNYKRCMHLYFVLILLVYTNFGSLVSSISTGDFPIDFELSIIVSGGIILLFTIKRDIKKLYYALILLFILIISAVVAKFKYGQPIYMGMISVIKKWFPVFLVPVFANYIKKAKNPYIIVQFVVIISLLICSLLCIQYFLLGDKYSLIDLTLKKRYNGDNGFLIHMISPVLLLCIAIIQLKRNKKLKDWLAIFFIFFTLAVVAKTRIFMCVALVIIVYCAFFYNKKIPLKSKYGVLFIGSILLIMFLPTVMNTIGDTFFSDVQQKGDNYIRFQEILWFDQVNVWPKWLGLGVENRAYQGSPFLTGVENYRYYVSDIGIFGMFFQYGIQGLIALLFYVIKMRELVGKKLGEYGQGLFNCLVLMILTSSVSVSPVQFIIPMVVVFSLLIGLHDRLSLNEVNVKNESLDRSNYWITPRA